MQPTYLPWAGYFNLAASVGRFVLLDDVQFDRRSWQCRNRILVNGAECFLTVPVAKAPRSALIRDIRTSSHARWTDDHVKTISMAYARAPFIVQVEDVVRQCIATCRSDMLSSVSGHLIRAFCERLSIDAEVIDASSLGCGGSRSQHLAEICKRLGCQEYLSPAGSKQYLDEDGFEEWSGLRLRFQEYVPGPYAQVGARQFVSHLSIVDVVANIGFDAASTYVRSGKYEA